MPNDFSNRKTIFAFLAFCIVGVAIIRFGPEILRVMSGLERMIFKSANEIRTGDTIRQVWNSGLFADPESSRHIYWVDDSTLLFKANKDPKPRTIDEARARVEWLYLWRLDEKPQPHGVDPKEAAVSYCAARGNVSYFQNVLDSSTGKKYDRRDGSVLQEKKSRCHLVSFHQVT